MQFLLNHSLEPVSIEGVNPNTTLLQWLRGHGKVGSKEGCAAGDCGACTVVIGNLNRKQTAIEYKSINACIALLPSVASKHVITVEGLADSNKLHPVQQAMVDCHGSQCGFCTPGFVMSLFALYLHKTQVNRSDIDAALSGNLCRCTGYEPIINAAMLAINQTPRVPHSIEKILPILQTLKQQKADSLDYQFNNQSFRYDCPRNIEQLAGILIQNPNAKLLAGSSDLGLEITQNNQQFTHIVELNSIEQMSEICIQDKMIEIGAACNLEQAWSILVDEWPALEPFLCRFASRPIRNCATLGGNIANASPIGDMPPVLLALNATLSLRRANQTRILALNDFFLDYKQTALKPSEFIERIHIPRLQKFEQFLVYKISKRFEDDISSVCMAMKASIENDTLKKIAIGFGAMAAISTRAVLLEKYLLDNFQSMSADEPIPKGLLEAMKQSFSPIDDVRVSAAYRTQVACTLLMKAVASLKGEQMINLGDGHHVTHALKHINEVTHD